MFKAIMWSIQMLYIDECWRIIIERICINGNAYPNYNRNLSPGVLIILLCCTQPLHPPSAVINLMPHHSTAHIVPGKRQMTHTNRLWSLQILTNAKWIIPGNYTCIYHSQEKNVLLSKFTMYSKYLLKKMSVQQWQFVVPKYSVYNLQAQLLFC